MLAAHSLRAGFYGFDDVVVAGTSADVAFQPLTDFLFAWIRVFFHQVYRAHDHAGRAKTTLQAVVLAERFLHWMQFSVCGKAFNGFDFSAFTLDGKLSATLYGRSVDVDDTGTALAGIAADMRSGQSEVFADKLNEQGAGFDFPRYRLAVHRHGYGDRHS